MSLFTEYLKREHEMIRSGIAILAAYQQELSEDLPVPLEDLRIASYALQLIESCHLAKEESLLYPVLEQAIMNRGPASPIASHWQQILEANENSKLCLLRLRLSLANYSATPDGTAVLASRLDEYIRQITSHIDREDHEVFKLADELLLEEEQKSLLIQAQQKKEEWGQERLQGALDLLNRLRLTQASGKKES